MNNPTMRLDLDLQNFGVVRRGKGNQGPTTIVALFGILGQVVRFFDGGQMAKVSFARSGFSALLPPVSFWGGWGCRVGFADGSAFRRFAENLLFQLADFGFQQAILVFELLFAINGPAMLGLPITRLSPTFQF
jgi:hypothetical protein